METELNYVLYRNTDGAEEIHIWTDGEFLECMDGNKSDLKKFKKGEILFYGSGAYINMLAAARKQIKPHEDKLK